MSDDEHTDDTLTQTVIDMSQAPKTAPCPRAEAGTIASTMRTREHLYGFDARRLPDLEHVGPLQSGSLRPFIGVDPPVERTTTFGDGRTVIQYFDGREVEVSRIVASLAETYQADEPMTMAQVGALTCWLDTSARSFEEAIDIGRLAGLDTEHAQRLAIVVGFKPVTVVRFEVAVDEDAIRIASVLGALGYTATRVMADPGARDRWALDEVARRYALSTSEATRARCMHADGESFGRVVPTYIEQCVYTKLGGKSLAQAMAEIAEVRP